MKNLKLQIAVMLAVFCTLTAFAQNNIVKLGLGGLATANLNLKYERVLTEKNSVNVNLGLKVPSGLPFNLDLNDIIDNNTAEEPKLNGFNISAEYRIYTGSQGAPQGFYFAPYLQFKNFAIQYDDVIDGHMGEAKINYGNIGAGLQLGAQWIISEKVSIDWYFLGLSVVRNNVKIRVESDDPDIDFFEEVNAIEKEYEDVPFIGDKLELDSGENFASLKTNFILPGFKTGVSIGYAF